jgi:eukaryotic-like serine/threonine-protein kinase
VDVDAENNGAGGGRLMQAPEVEGCDAVRRLGGGASATVWLVQPRDGSAPLAAKCFAPDVPAFPESFAGGHGRHNESEITQEWRILAQYDHDHLLRAHRVVPLGGDWAGGRALLMDYAAGGSVRDIVAARGPLTVGECVTILTPLGQVLAFLHGAGIQHGDVSPGNVLLTAHGKPVLADLGLGRLVGQVHTPGGGTPGFFCPLDPAVSAGSDVYSMAAVGWFALTGQAPPPTRDRMPLAMYAPGVPPELAAALEAGLSENAVQRPTAATFAQAVFRSAKAEPVALAHAVHPSVLPELLTRRSTREPRGKGHLRRVGSGRWRTLAVLPKVRGRGDAGGFQAGRQPGGGSRRRQPGLRRRGWLRHGWAWVAATAAAVAAICVVAWLGMPGVPALGLHGPGHPEAGHPEAGHPEAGPSVAAVPVPVPSSGTQGGRSVAPAPADAAAKAALGTVAAKIPAEVRDELVSPDPAKALGALAWVRSYALTSGEFQLLETVNALGSPTMKADAATAADLQRVHHSFSGMETAVTGAAVTGRKLLPAGSDAPSPAAVVAATVSIGPYAEQDAAGSVVHRQDKETAQKLDVVLIFVSGRWLVQEILPAGSKGVP